MPKTTCRTCKNCNLKLNVCEEEMWDRNAEDEAWLHSDDDFNAFLDTDRFCTQRIAITQN
jgi:hypothetical protein